MEMKTLMIRIFLPAACLLSSMATAQISGHVLDQNNTPLPGTVVYDVTDEIFKIQNNETTLTEHLTRAISDNKGHFTLKSDTEQPLLVARDMEGNFSVSAANQTSEEPFTFIFKKPAALTGKIMEGPLPKADAQVVIALQGYPRNFMYSFTTKTNRDGVFNIEAMMPGSYAVLVIEDIPAIGCMSAVVTKQKRVSLTPGQSAQIQLGGQDMPSLNGKVTTADNKPLHGVWVRLNPEQPTADSETSVWADVTDPNGCYHIYDIPPGTYNIECVRRLAQNTPTRLLKENIQVQIKDKTRMASLSGEQFNNQPQTRDIQIDIDPFMPLTIGQKAPDIESQTIDGKKWSLKQHRGKVVVIHFYTTKCKYCKPNFAGFESVYNTFRPNVEVLGISLDKTLAECQDFITQTSTTHPQIFEAAAFDISGQYRVTEIPTSFVIDKEGNIAQIDLFGATLAKFIEDAALIDN